VAWPDRHGRWPLIAAAAAGPSTALVLSDRDRFLAGGAWTRWLPLSALLLHQTEEWVRPGGFLPWFNREVMGSGEDEFPITRRDGLIINAGLGWGTALAAGAAGERAPAIAAAQLAMDVGNAGLHIAEAARQRRYNPGLATATLLFLPVGVAGLARLLADPGTRPQARAGAAAGFAAAGTMMAVMRRRVSRRG
jgi:hypothetical protein